MKIIDISWPITQDMTAYKDKRVVSFAQTKTFENDGARESVITIGAHSGTHIDAPAHFLKEGASIESYALEQLCGMCRVIDCTSTDVISSATLAGREIGAGDIVLFKTRNSTHQPTDAFDCEFVYVDASAARELASCQVRAVGIDYLGIERNQPAHETHELLLSNNIPIIEGLRLNGVEPGYYDLICLPLNIVGLEAAPARAVLIA